jgi:hypothetical protein
LWRNSTVVAAIAVLAPNASEAVESIGVSKELQGCTVGISSEFVCSFTLYIENLGDVPLSNVQAVDDLLVTFPAPATFSIPPGSITATGGLTTNSGFDGALDTNLLAGSDTIAVGSTSTLSFGVNVDPNGSGGNINTVVIISQGTAGPVTDISDNGTNPDPDGDGFADGPGEDDPTPVIFPATPVPALSARGFSLLAVLLGASATVLLATRSANRRAS